MSKTRRGRQLIIAGLCAAFACVRCSNIPVAGGGGSETINAKVIISDTIAYFEADTKPGDLLQVRIYSDQYRPYERIGLADSLSGDSGSTLAWHAPNSGGFNFLLSNDPSGNAAFVSAVRLKPGLRDTILCTLKTSYVLKGKIESQTPGSAYILFIQGSPFFCMSDTMRHFSMPSFPSGRYILKTRPAAGKLFMSTSDYLVDTDSLGDNVSVVIEGKQ